MQLSWLEKGTLLERYTASLYSKAENTKRAYLLDLCVFFRELFIHFWEFDIKYNFIAKEIALKYLENQETKKLSSLELKELREQENSNKLYEQLKTKKERNFLPVLQLYQHLFGHKPAIKSAGGKLTMDLDPSPSGIDGLVEMKKEDYELVNLVFKEYGKWLEKEKDFWHELFDYEKVVRVMGHLKERHCNSNNTLARKYTTLRSFELFLKRIGLLEKTILPEIDRPRVVRNERPYLTGEEMLSFLESIRPIYTEGDKQGNLRIRDRAMFELLYGTGLRISELTNLTTKDVDLEKRILKLHNTKSGQQEERVCLPRGIIKYLDLYGKYRGYLYLDTEEKKEFYFLNNRGRQVNQRGFFRILQKYLAKAKVREKIGPHTIRRSMAKALEEKGADLRSIQQILRHRNPSTTEIYLGNFSQARQERTLKRYHPRG